jgi:hypothetical protein
MSGVRMGAVALTVSVAQILAQGLFITLAIILTLCSILAVFGWLPWPQIALSFGDEPVATAGMWLQLGVTAVSLLLLFYLPANTRMSRLERSHRSFAVGIEDVAHAYRRAHAADRAGVFSLSGEFDAIRARMEHLREHPDLQHLEPELLQLAAQMSHETRELARAYSDDKVARAKMFLRQRQEEVQSLTDRIEVARRTCDELRRWMQDIDTEERIAQVQLRRLEADLKEILPTLGYDIELDDIRDANVVPLPKPHK